MLGDGTLRGYIDELSVTGLTSNPTIFDKAISGGDAYDEQIVEVAPTVAIDRGALLRAGARRPARRDRPLRARSTQRTAGVDGFCSLEVSPLIADDTEATIEQAAQLHGKGERREPLHQDPRHRGRPAGDRGVDLRRDPDQRHPALRHRAVPGRRRRLPEGDRTADRGRPRPRRRLGRLDLHEPLGRRGHRTRCPAELQEPARAGGRLPRLPRLPRAARLAAHAAADERGRAARSACSGRAPGPRTPRPPTSSTSRASPRRSPSTRCPSRPCTPSPTTARSATRCRPTAATADEVLAQFDERRDRRRRARGAAPGGGQGGLRQVLGRDAEVDRDRARSNCRVTPEPRCARRAGLEGAGGPLRRARATPTCATSSPPTRRAASGWSPTAPASTSTSPRTGSPTRR